jgi:hypothetical protein
MSKAGRTFLAIAAAALVGVVVAAAVDRRDLAFTNGVPVTRIAAVLRPGVAACQRRVLVVEGFRAVEITPTALGHHGTPPLAVEVRDSRTRRRLAMGSVPGGYPDHLRRPVPVGSVRAGARVDVCVVNRGEHRIGLAGGKAESVPDSPLVVGALRDERRALTLRFLRGHPRSVLSQVPVIFRRASLFRPGWVGPWTFWLLGALVALGVPALLSRALAAAEPDA